MAVLGRRNATGVTRKDRNRKQGGSTLWVPIGVRAQGFGAYGTGGGERVGAIGRRPRRLIHAGGKGRGWPFGSLVTMGAPGMGAFESRADSREALVTEGRWMRGG
jgi:hypothetical protein